MATKEFEKYDYDFAKRQKSDFEKRLKVASFAFAVIILLFACWSFFNSLDIFKTTTTQVTQPIQDPTSVDQERIAENQAQIDAYKNVRIPYRDPQNRFTIDFSTPYVSSRIAVYINNANEREKIIQEANDVISEAKKSVTITSVMYINNY